MIYFIECADRVKIGYSGNPKRRFEMLSTGMPFPAKLLGVAYGDKAEEKRLHGDFSGQRITGEWFEKSPRLEEVIGATAIRSVGFEDSDFHEFITTPPAPIRGGRHPLSEHLKATGESLTDFAVRVEMSRMQLYRIMNGESTTTDTLRKISAATDGKVPVSDLVEATAVKSQTAEAAQ